MLPPTLGGQGKESSAMPVTKEFTVLMENRPTILGRICQALADQEVNILALESVPTRGKFVTRFMVDNPDIAKTVLNNEKLTFAEKEIIQIKIQHRPGEIARLASRLGRIPTSITLTAVWSHPRMRKLSFPSPKAAWQAIENFSMNQLSVSTWSNRRRGCERSFWLSGWRRSLLYLSWSDIFCYMGILCLELVWLKTLAYSGEAAF